MPLDDLLAAELDALRTQGRYRALRPIDGAQGATVLLDGRPVVNLCSNDYLGLASHPAVAAAARAALEHGFGAGSARLVAGDFSEHHALESTLAAFKRTEASLLFSTGYHANVGAVAALAGPEDAVYSDELNHASLIDGCRLSRAAIHVYRHVDLADLERQLRAGARFRRRLVVSDSIFGMDGDALPVAEWAALARSHGAITLLDEAHATGVRGPGGRGLAAEAGTDIDVQVGTLGKALGAFGAFVAGSRALCDLLVNRARTFVFTTAPPPPLCAAARAAVDLCASAEGDARRAHLRALCTRLRAGLAALGHAAPPDAHVFAVVLGDDARAIRARDALLARGFLVGGIRPPTVPAGTARLRLAPTAAHTPAQIDAVLDALSHVVR